MVTLSLLLAGDTNTIERALIAHYVACCVACRSGKPFSWPMLCPLHGPIVRSFIEPKYIPSLREDRQQLLVRIEKLDWAIDAKEHLAVGEQWISENLYDARIDLAYERLEAWRLKIPAGMSDIPIGELLREREQLSADVDSLTQHLARLKVGGESITKTISRDEEDGEADGELEAAPEAEESAEHSPV